MTTSRPRARRSMPVVVTLDGDNTHLANLCGPLDENLRQLADGMGVKLSRRGSRVTIEGELDDISGQGQTRAAIKLCKNIPADRKMHYTAPNCGHYGIFSGRRWREMICPKIAEFIRQSA